jgi:hypothetical protein
MSDIALINDSQQSAIVTNGIGKNGEIYMKAAGSTDAGALVVYDSGSWRKFADEAGGAFNNTYSVSFDGSNDYIQLPNGVLTALSGTAYTISAWYNLDIVGNYQMLFTASSNWQIFYRPSSTQVRLELYINGASRLIQPTPYSNVGSWVHGCISVDTTGTSTMYINGSSNASAVSVPQATSISNPVIGSQNGSGYFLNGYVDEMAIFNSALSASDVTSIYNSGVPNDISSLSPVNWWRMGDNDGGTGTTITDQGTGGNNGTLTNGPTFSSSVPS